MRHRTMLFFATSGIALIGGEAVAQVAPTPETPTTSAAGSASPGATSDTSNSLTEIIVTAQRRSENLQRAAAAVSVRNGTDLLTSGKFALSSILEDVPGIQGGAAQVPGGIPGSSAGTDSPAAGLTVRGIPSNVGVGGSAVSVATSAAIYVDGIYSGVGGTYDIDRVEVLRGPQGTLYGRSATSGLVAIRTRNPSLTAVDGNIAVERGNFDLAHYTGAVNVPIVTDMLALRVSGNYYRRDGYNSHGFGGSIRNGDYRAKLLFQPSDDVALLLGFTGEDNKLGSENANYTELTPTTYLKTFGPVGTGRNHFRQYWAELNWTLGGVTLTYEPAYRTWRSSAINYVRVPAINASSDQAIETPKDHFWTHELRLASAPGGRLTWQTGAFYYDNKLLNSTTARDGFSQALQFSTSTDKKTKATGIFGEATYAIADDWRFNGGVRYDHTKVQVGQTFTANLNLSGMFGGGPLGSSTYALPEVLVSQTLAGAAGTRTFNNVTYKARIEHDLSPTSLLYALTATGFSPGDLGVTTGTDLAPVSLVFASQTLTSYEIGSKNRFLDNRLQVNLAGFYYVYGGYQVANINISPLPGTSAFSTVSAPARAYGVELEMLYRPTRRDRLGLNLSYTKAYFVHASQQIVPGSGGNTFGNYFAKSGIPGVIPLDTQFNYDHDFDFFGSSRLTAHGDVRLLSGHMIGPVTQAQVTQGAEPFAHVGSEVIGDITATWSSPGGRFSVSGYIRNIANNRYKNSATVSVGLPGSFAATVQLYDPRTYGIILAAKL